MTNTPTIPGKNPHASEPGRMEDGLWNLLSFSTSKPRKPWFNGKAVILKGTGFSQILADTWWKEEVKQYGEEPELFTLNDDNHKRSTRHFQIHEDLGGRNSLLHVQHKIDSGQVKLITRENFPFAHVRRRFFCSTADYFLAIADLEGFSRVYMPGCDFSGPEYEKYRRSVLWWIGVLEGKGASVTISPFSKLFKHKEYS